MNWLISWNTYNLDPKISQHILWSIGMFMSGPEMRNAIAGPTYEENVMYTWGKYIQLIKIAAFHFIMDISVKYGQSAT